MYQGLHHPRPVKVVKPGSRHPFKRVLALYAKVEEIRQKFAIDTLEYQVAIAALPPYESHGKGAKYRTKNRLIAGRWNQSRSKYVPHQGKSECARRVFQAAPAWVRKETRLMEGMV